MELIEDLRNEIQVKFRKMDTEQFREFAIDWFRDRDSSEIIYSESGKKFAEEDLNVWFEMIKTRMYEELKK